MTETAAARKQDNPAEYRCKMQAFAASELAALIASTPLGDRMWLRNPKQLDVDGQGAEQVVLRYISPTGIDAGRLKEEILTGLMQWPRIFGQTVEPYFSGEGEVINNGELRLTLEHKGMRIPVTIYMTGSDDPAAEPVSIRHAMVFDPDRYADILELSYEDEAAECLGQIFEKMELIDDMGAYWRLSNLLSSEALRGHRIGERFAHICEEKNIILSDERFALFESYGTYIYMKRKWSKYKKRHQKMSLEWENTHSIVSQFAKPIYDAISRADVFFGDWMPELMRFLD